MTLCGPRQNSLPQGFCITSVVLTAKLATCRADPPKTDRHLVAELALDAFRQRQIISVYRMIITRSNARMDGRTPTKRRVWEGGRPRRVAARPNRDSRVAREQPASASAAGAAPHSSSSASMRSSDRPELVSTSPGSDPIVW